MLQYMKGIDFTALLLKIGYFLLVLSVPIRPSLAAATALVIADMISGVWASIKERKKITSSAFRRTIIKLLAYYSAIIVAFVLQQYLLNDMPILKVITGLIGLTEGKSFFENLHRITGIDFWGQILSKLNMVDLKNPKDPSEK